MEHFLNDKELTKSRQRISEASFMDEQEAVRALLTETARIESLHTDISQRARTLVEHMRKRGGGGGVEAFLHEYGLDTQEGVAVMCLAEALLRIPDNATAEALIQNTFEHTDWETHIGSSESLFVNASSWGLLLTGKVVNLKDSNPLGIIGKAINSLGEPVIRESLKAAMKIVGGQFVLGETTLKALKAAKNYTKNNYKVSFDILGEGARTEAQAAAYEQSYLNAIEHIAKESAGSTADEFSLSVKLSALHPRLHLVKRERLHAELIPRLRRILLKAKSVQLSVSIDAEEAARLDINLELFTALMDDQELQGWNGLGYVVQAYQKRASMVIDYLAILAKRSGRRIPIRLVKGAYWDSEIKWTQMAGLPNYPVFTRKEHTDVSYLACVVKLLENVPYFYPQFATHNARTVASIITLAQAEGVPADAFEFQHLHGMGEMLHDQLLAEYNCRIYAPVGEHRDLLAYLIRRLMENSANTSFVHLVMDQETTVDHLITNPITTTSMHQGGLHPRIPLPQFLYGSRWQNSCGLDVAYLHMHDALKNNLEQFSGITWRARPLVAFDVPKNLDTRNITAPANTSDVVGQATDASEAMVEKAAAIAALAHEHWNEVSPSIRADILEKAAASIESHFVELMSMLIREAGKTWSDGVAEVREAADFCRFYAAEARKLFIDDVRPGPTGESNVLNYAGRGVFVCISPWNFPLAIFTGQIAAALVTGNSVLAKPAEQTPLIAYKMVELLHDAGIPHDVLQLLPGDGATIGNALVNHPEVSGVVFTGSDITAKLIHRNLANRSGGIIPFIAETGGINSMVVDSSALLEQACDDIILSAFGSAGQRCSALRLLMVQEDIADDLMKLLAGAMQELALGDPRHFDVDIGPVIDADAKKMLDAHIAELHESATFVAKAPISDEAAANAHIVVPHIFELKQVADLKQEFFGPILHVVRFKYSELSGLPQRINRSGYGLTFGIHSRIQDHIHLFTSQISVGNVYVNRGMTGAVVGVQPFGGEGLSGTGPKAGGPHYLTRFVAERHVTINTAAIGGNISLLSQ